MNLTQITCPYCHFEMIKKIKSYEIKHNGTRHLYKCKQCNKVFSETKGSFLEKLVKPKRRILYKTWEEVFRIQRAA